MDLIKKFETLYTNNKIRTYFISFLLVLIAFGSKLFFESYAPDDYARIFTTEKWHFQADRGRWATSILNNFIFKNELFVLPYFNTIISLFCISLGAFFVSQIWNIKKNVEIILIVLLLTVSTFWANNLFFNSNVTVSIGALFTGLGLFLIIKKQNYNILGFLLLIFSFGIYQTSFQSSIIIVVSCYILGINKAEENNVFGKQFFRFLKVLGTVIVSFLISSIISEVIFKLTPYDSFFNPYLKASREFDIYRVIKKTFSILTSPRSFFFSFIPNITLGILTTIIILSGCFSFLFNNLKKFEFKKIILIFLILLLFLSLIIQLPRLMSVSMPPRASFHFSFLLALFFLISIKSKIKIFKNISLITVLLYIVVSFTNISIFYNNSNKQTQSDIKRANQIANRILANKEQYHYKNQIPNFLILGEKKFPLKSKNYTKFNYNTLETNSKDPIHVDLQAFNTYWSKYEIFKHFTDFDFIQVNDIELTNKIIKELSSKKESVNEYPDSGSIHFINNTVVLVLDKKLLSK